MPAVVTISEAASQLGVSVDTVKRRIAANQLPARREPRPQGYRWLVELPDDLLAQATTVDATDVAAAADETTVVAVLRAEIRRLEELVQLLAADLDTERAHNVELLTALRELSGLVRASLERAPAESALPPARPAADVTVPVGDNPAPGSRPRWWWSARRISVARPT